MNKRIATFLIFLSAALLSSVVIVEKFHPEYSEALGWVKAFLEASLIGGLADWFAVTALFRHPLSLPIPHTKIIPKEKLRIAKVLSQFLKSTFLTEEGISREFTQERMRLLAEKSITLSPDTISHIQKILREIITSFSAEFLKNLQADESREKCIDVFLNFLLSRSAQLKIILKEKLPLPWYVPSFLRHKVSENFIDTIIDSIQTASKNRNDSIRIELGNFLVSAVEKLKSEDLFKSQGLSKFNFVEFIKISIIENDILFEPVKDLLIAQLPLFHSTLDSLIERTFHSFSDEEIVEKIEGALIHDLQWIRINGTLVGGILGVVFHAVKTFSM